MQEFDYQDNYTKVKEEWKKMACTWNFKERYEALGLSGYDDNMLTLKYYGQDYQINPKTGEISEKDNPDAPVDFNTTMNIYHLFYYSKEKPRLSGEWVPFRDVPRAGVFTKAFFDQTVDPFARTFNGHLKELIKAGEKLGFERISYSDAGFEAQVFDCLPIRFLFWEGDEEFPARANVLFDRNIVEFVHEETVVLIAADGLKRLIMAAELPQKGKAYRFYAP
ncbi:MAG: DUF3786 domain-containing protein [Ruminococcus sp.]|jgi:hypothetical protein